MLAVIRRPDPQRWFALVNGYWTTTRLLPVASKTSEFGTDWYRVENPDARSAFGIFEGCHGRPMLHGPVQGLVHLDYSSFQYQMVDWGGTALPANSGILCRVRSVLLAHRPHGCYHIKHEKIGKLGSRVVMPCTPIRTVNELLGQALGDDRFIETMNHHVVHDLTMGQSLN